MTVEMNGDNFDEITSSEGIVLVSCRARWCGNCDESAEAYRRTAARHPGHRFATLDTDDQKDIRAALGIRHVPSLLVYRDGVLLFNQPGSYDESALDNIIAQAESLDMDRVRAEIASASSASEA